VTARPDPTPVILPAAEWRARLADHAASVRSFTRPYAARRAANRPHPVHDFLFTYYHFSMRKLEAWHPGAHIGLADDGAPCPWQTNRFYHLRDGVWQLDLTAIDAGLARRLGWIATLLRATAGRQPNFACHGLHEWAMVFRAEDVRHAGSVPLRLPQADIDALVASRPLLCTHFDAFRFFAPTAQPLNRHALSLDARPDLEQPGCLHANMDLYKWAYKSMPWIGSDILMDAFHLALALRELDMRASPYDLSAFGYPPIPIETADGRRDYESLQRSLAERAAPLRARLIKALERTLRG
jgi:hypothetical protein